jgi:hypothetical protein
MSKYVVLVVMLVAAMAYAQAPPAGTPVPEPGAAEISVAQQTATRLRKLWTGGDVALLNRVNSAAYGGTNEDTSDMLGRFNTKYGVYDPYFDATKTQKRTDIPDPTGADIVGAGSPEMEDYKSVYNNANKKDLDPSKDSPDNLETMLGSLWGKRYGYMSEAQRDDAARAEKTLVISATPTSVLRQGIQESSDGSVQKWIAMADDAAQFAPPEPEPPFKPKSFWYGPKVVTDAIDVTHEALDGHGRTPSEPPKPPVDSFVFAEPKPAANADPASKITIIERITVTKAGTTSADPRPPEPTFNPIMTKDALRGLSKKAIIV